MNALRNFTSIRCFSSNCQRAHGSALKKDHEKVIIIKKAEDLFPIVRDCFKSTTFSNTPIHFKFDTDGQTLTSRNLRIIHNPKKIPIKVGVLTTTHEKILGGYKTLPKCLVEIITKEFSINVVLFTSIDGSIDGKSGFSFLENLEHSSKL